jgi:hypothetical protein
VQGNFLGYQSEPLLVCGDCAQLFEKRRTDFDVLAGDLEVEIVGVFGGLGGGFGLFGLDFGSQRLGQGEGHQLEGLVDGPGLPLLVAPGVVPVVVPILL